MRKPGGYALVTQPVGSDQEADTFTCCHCNSVVILAKVSAPAVGSVVFENKQAEDLGGFCMRCMKNICGPCADTGICTPYEERLRKAEARERALLSYGL